MQLHVGIQIHMYSNVSMEAQMDLAQDLLSGVRQIAGHIGKSERATYHMIENLACRRFGGHRDRLT